MVDCIGEVLTVRFWISALVARGQCRLSLNNQYKTCGLGGHRVTPQVRSSFGRDTSLKTGTVLSEGTPLTRVHDRCSEEPGSVLARSRGTMRSSIPTAQEPRRRKPSDPDTENETVHLCLGRPQHSALKLLAPLYLDPTQPN